MNEKMQELKGRLGTVSDVHRASALLGWDQQTYMPPRGAAARAEQLATLDKIAHQLFTADEIGKLLGDLADEVAKHDYDSDEASLIRVTRRDYDKAKRVPPELIENISRTTALAFAAWTKARAESNFKMFQPDLEKIIDLEIQLANHLGYTDRVYDALLDQYEPLMTTAQVAAIFAGLKQELLPLVRAIGQKTDRVNGTCLHREYDEAKQWSFGVEIIKRFGFDFERGRQDKSVHPFTTDFGLDDTRITTRVDPHFLSPALFGTLHECGHALYDMGYRPELERTPLEGGASLGAHESQSRLWENVVGRSRGFWKYWFPRLREVFPSQLADQDAESFYRAVNKSMPSLIRVEADEVTYTLHILLRFELENDLVERKLKVADLPEAWNAKMKEYLGIVPPDDARGVLQDIHWSIGSVGYFATYSLGTIFSLQLYDRAVKDVPAIPTQIEHGEYGELLKWLRTNLHQHGRKFTLDELARKITGEPLQTRSYLRYLKNKYGEIYGL
ncbi:MAG: carboxypeptidase M32 [Chloroflexota bacterium]|nr:carboxypeptidase M32 [Chloroflexota bacterium]